MCRKIIDCCSFDGCTKNQSTSVAEIPKEAGCCTPKGATSRFGGRAVDRAVAWLFAGAATSTLDVVEEVLCAVEDLRALTDFAVGSVSFASVEEALDAVGVAVAFAAGFGAVASAALVNASASVLLAVFVVVVVDFARAVVVLVEALAPVLALVFRVAGFAAGFSAAVVSAAAFTVSSPCCSFFLAVVVLFAGAAVLRVRVALVFSGVAEASLEGAASLVSLAGEAAGASGAVDVAFAAFVVRFFAAGLGAGLGLGAGRLQSGWSVRYRSR